jgi:hypothetical protein
MSKLLKKSKILACNTQFHHVFFNRPTTCWGKCCGNPDLDDDSQCQICNLFFTS